MLLQKLLISSIRRRSYNIVPAVVSLSSSSSSSKWCHHYNTNTTSYRTFATRRKTKIESLHPDIVNNLPYFDDDIDETLTPKSPEDAHIFPDHPITSAHCIDVQQQQLSNLDSVIVNPMGQVIHGRYGTLSHLGATTTIPLEYLALLHFAAEGAAALRVISKNYTITHGTLLVYGASQACGIATAQLANSIGNTVIAVIDGEHSGNDDMIECIKGLMNEPGTAVPEEYALSKKLFMDLVDSISTGNENIITPSPQQYLDEFKKNFYDYIKVYPDTKPAAVSDDVLKFEYMEKDREYFDDNMAAYLEQYPPGSPPINHSQIESNFTIDQYEIFRKKFWHQTSDVISGGELPFSAPHLVKQLSEEPETNIDNRTYPGAGEYFPYSFSILNQSFPTNTEMKKGGPIMGAVINVTKTLLSALSKLEKAGSTSSLRSQGEALQFLSRNEKAAYHVVRCIIAIASKAKTPIIVVGNGDGSSNNNIVSSSISSLPGIESVHVTDDDVKYALNAMDIMDNGESKLNYYIQAYRANDYSFYSDYAIHRASEPLAGPRQIIVTK